MNFIDAFKMMGGNPKNMLMSFLQNTNTNNPMINQLVQSLEKGDTASIERFARDYCSKNGMDFDNEFAAFMKNFSR